MMSLLFDMLADNDGESLSTARVTSFICAIVGVILCVLGFFDIGVNSEYAYTLIGIGAGVTAMKSISSQFTKQKEEQ